MRISIYSGNTYVFGETIAKIDTAPTKSVDTEATPSFDETFNKIKDILQNKIDEKNNVSSNPSSNVEVVKEMAKTLGSSSPSVSEMMATVSDVDVYHTPEGYTSIAPTEYQDIFAEASAIFGIDQKLLELIGYHESRFQPEVTSSAGAMGIMQLMPDTAKGLEVENAYDARANIMGGAKLLSRLANDYNGNLDLMLAGYSAGQGAVSRYDGIPPYKETTDYIAWIHERYP